MLTQDHQSFPQNHWTLIWNPEVVQRGAVGVTLFDGGVHRGVRDVHRDAYHHRCAYCDRPEVNIKTNWSKDPNLQNA